MHKSGNTGNVDGGATSTGCLKLRGLFQCFSTCTQQMLVLYTKFSQLPCFNVLFGSPSNRTVILYTALDTLEQPLLV